MFIDVLRGRRELPRFDHVPAYSVVTRTELFAGHVEEVTQIRLLLDPFAELGVDREIAEHAGYLRRTTGLLTPDALMAATALAGDRALMTRNRRYFERVAGLELIAP